ncbi:hypothetical protein PRIPAC_72914 [Pristionchus pacificus]|uniref:Zinc finger CCCH domain-containing protein 14 n=1 Tax=Pristionchus pacificus TaxID=54126 RepID=A0A2A6CSV9_PRIPA|nr:hypothetical protein PRIPAC_72914 [Pristionchus pacificus]|eukprot:PDM81123.1 hypothetical protein PRIPAC_36126 [Pristionchus pacificus]
MLLLYLIIRKVPSNSGVVRGILVRQLGQPDEYRPLGSSRGGLRTDSNRLKRLLREFTRNHASQDFGTMTNNKDPVLNWLRFHECRDDFVNSYYFALLLANLPKTGFKIPTHILIEELEKEETNEKHNRLSDYENQLNVFLNNDKIYPSGTSNPLPPNKSFKSLSTEVKLWIFCQLIQSGGVPRDTPEEIGMDSHRNRYFIVEGRLYINYGKILEEITREDKKYSTNLTPLENYCRKQQGTWKELAETAKLWKNIALILENFDEVDIANKILMKMEIAMKNILTDEQKEEEGNEFTAYLKSIGPQPAPRRGQYQTKNDPYSESPPTYEELMKGFGHLGNPTSIAHSDHREEDSGRILIVSSDLRSRKAPFKKTTSIVHSPSRFASMTMLRSLSILLQCIISLQISNSGVVRGILVRQLGQPDEYRPLGSSRGGLRTDSNRLK